MATIHDVAREAGVSIATVSRSLNGRARVSEKTRARVLEVAAALEFHPNRAARGLVTGKLGNVGVLVPDLTNPFFTPILAGIEEVAQSRDMGVFVADTREDVDAEGRLITRLSQQVDGVVLVASRMDEVDLLDLRIKDKAVLVNRVVRGMSSVAIDAYQGMSELVDHLGELGHTRIAYLDGPSRSSLGRSKRLGLADRAKELGIDLIVLGHRQPTFAAGRESAEEVRSLDVTAVVAFDDLIAWGLITRLQELGVEIPQELSIAGFDDAIEEGMVRPALTSVSPQGTSLGIRAMDLLLDRLQRPAAPASVEMLGCIVKKRDSTRSILA